MGTRLKMFSKKKKVLKRNDDGFQPVYPTDYQLPRTAYSAFSQTENDDVEKPNVFREKHYV